MEAPEKIKIGKHNITSDGDVIFGWVTNSPDCEAMQHDIEYTRTDAFIEKARKWLDDHMIDYMEFDEYSEMLCGFDEDKMLKHFVNYMKGE